MHPQSLYAESFNTANYSDKSFSLTLSGSHNGDEQTDETVHSCSASKMSEDKSAIVRQLTETTTPTLLCLFGCSQVHNIGT